ncbi:MAG: YebC/PmpR family DNA-binding transcriptional regulator [Chloroflexota bacterium]|nr:MAG: YebC/PmpR family DNA-binding transcriptional regulator [Chloroflexota bacterium]
MSGHSKWAQIKRQKGVADAKRGQVFTKLGRELMVAVRQGGPDPAGNARLRLAIQKARENNMPLDNIDRAVKRAAGALDGAALEEITYEGYGPHGVAVMIQALSDNRNRTVAEIRNVFTRANGSLGESGSVSWLFEQKGVITVDANGADPEELALLAIDAGADDVKVDEQTLEVYTDPSSLETVREALERSNMKIESSEISLLPKTTVPITGEKEATSVLRLIDKLDDLDDVQEVFSNADIPAEVMEGYGG